MRGRKDISRRLGWVLLSVIISSAGTSCALMPAEEELPAAPVLRSYEVTEYEQATVLRGNMELTMSVRCTYVSAKQETYSFSLGGALIDRVYVSEGQKVAEGELLAALEQGNLPDRIAAGEHELRVLEARKSYIPEFERLELAIYDSVEADAEGRIKPEAEKQRQSIQEAYEKQLREAEDALYIARLRLEETKEELREREICSGIGGTVTYIQKVKEGDRSVKGKTFVTVADLDTVVFTVKGEDAQYFPVGTQATVLCSKKEFPVRAVEASELGIADPGSGSIAYLRLLNPDPALENGASGSIRLVLDRREDVLYVDKDAVKAADGERFVYMLDEKGLRTLQKVATGLETGDWVEIVSGLAEGDSVILD